MGKLSDNRIRLSLNKIKGLPDNSPGVDRVNYKDIDCPELTLSVMKSGSKIFCVFYRVYAPDGTSKPSYYNLGNALHWSIEEAQNTAREVVKKGREGWDYKKYQATLSRAISEDKRAEQIDVSLASIGQLPGQLARGWDDMVKRKFDLADETKQNLRGTYRKHIMSYFGEDKWISDISEQDFIEFKAHFNNRRTMFNRVRAYLVQVFEDEVYNERLTKNVVKKVPEYPSKDAYCILTDKGIETFFTTFGNPESYIDFQRNYCRYVMLLLLTGQRPINLRTLQKRDDGEGNYIDWENSQLVYRQHKTTKKAKNIAERIAINDEVLEIFKQASAENPESKWAIPSCDKRVRYRKTQLSEERSREFFNRYRDKLETAGEGEMTIYNLRHTYATKMLSSGIPRERVGAMLLHSPNSRATSKYARILDETKRETAEIAKSIFKR